MMINIFVPSYHRADNCKTVEVMLNKYGWDPKKLTVFVDDEEQENVDAYKKLQKEKNINLHVFDINKARENFDFIHRASPSRRAAGMCRNVFWEYAEANNIDYYVVMDDNTTSFGIKHIDRERTCRNKEVVCEVFNMIVDFMKRKRIGCFALPQSGDFIGGNVKGVYLNKVMNTTFYCTKFVHGGEAGVQDNDTTQFVNMHNRGMFTGSTGYGLILHQRQSCTAKGGLTDLYKECKLLNKSLVCVIQFPSAITAMHQKKNGGRIHHSIKDKYLRPRIMKGKRGNIAWDTYEEDVPFTMQTFNDWRQKKLTTVEN